MTVSLLDKLFISRANLCVKKLLMKTIPMYFPIFIFCCQNAINSPYALFTNKFLIGFDHSVAILKTSYLWSSCRLTFANLNLSNSHFPGKQLCSPFSFWLRIFLYLCFLFPTLSDVFSTLSGSLHRHEHQCSFCTPWYECSSHFPYCFHVGFMFPLVSFITFLILKSDTTSF